MLKGKVAVITGGTRGIGLQVVKTFHQNHAQVILPGSRKETVEKALNSLKAENIDADGYYPNLSNYDEVDKRHVQHLKGRSAWKDRRAAGYLQCIPVPGKLHFRSCFIC